MEHNLLRKPRRRSHRKAALPAERLLVAPQMSEIFDADGVSFPKGVRHDYWSSSQRLIDTSHVTIQPKLDLLPVFVRAGSIIPQQQVVQSTAEFPIGLLQLRVYSGPNCQGSVYLDDGPTFKFRRGAYLRENFSCQASDSGIRIRIAPREGRFQPWWKQVQIQIAGVSQSPRQWKLNGTAGDNAATEVKSGSFFVTVPDPREGSEIKIQCWPEAEKRNESTSFLEVEHCGQEHNTCCNSPDARGARSA